MPYVPSSSAMTEPHVPANGRRAATNARPAMNVEKIFGENTFGLEAMQSRLPKSIYQRLLATIEQGAPIDESVADAIALAMKEWAVERGATHFTHWFQPLTGRTAEKHDSFITPNAGGGAVAQFSGKNLFQGEPDASSFPSGGLRATFEARGYTAYDPTSPAFIIEHNGVATLCIPTAFASWTGEALDFKTPLLRSMGALGSQAARALRLFGEEARRVFATLGCEQEYFVIDAQLYHARPDLSTAGRTLLGARPPRGQELEDHYFGTIPERVMTFMNAVEEELYRLGVPVATRHNEVAPGQYEIAPLFENANIAADHQQLMMMTLQRFAPRFGLTCLLHEKPFAGVNGSGKHCNFSLATETGLNLLDPGETPHENLIFLFFCTAVIQAVHRHQGLLRASIASAANDHRLGANEAPPAILSIFLGEQLTHVFSQIAEHGKATESKQSGLLGLGTPVLPRLPRQAGDRNRTSPLAFTGNKFEFRAVGSGQSVSLPATVLCTIVAEAVDELATSLEEKLGLERADETASKEAVENAVHDVIAESIRRHEAIIFNGDGYSEEWRREAEARGLLNLRTTPEALPELTTERAVEAFATYDVLSRTELESRRAIFTERYAKTINIEAATTESMARTMILPAAVRYLQVLVDTFREGNGLGFDVAGLRPTAEAVSEQIGNLQQALDELGRAREAARAAGRSEEHRAAHEAAAMNAKVVPAMRAVRAACDALEAHVPADLWPLPTYREMLFIK